MALDVAELRIVWYEALPDFSSDGKNIIPTYQKGCIRGHWSDGDYHSVHQYACRCCHTKWNSAQDMLNSDAIIFPGE
jgi:hypothetical protein